MNQKAKIRFPSAVRLVTVLLFAAAASYVGFGVFRLSRENRKLSDENRALRDEAAAAAEAVRQLAGRMEKLESQAGSPSGQGEADAAEKRHPRKKGRRGREEVEQPVEPPKTDPHKDTAPTLAVLGKTTARATDRGIVATLEFRPTGEEPLGVFAVVARLPRDSNARILDFSPVGGASYTGHGKRIAEDGKFAAFQGMPGNAADLAFDLLVSGPVVATIGANCGIDHFELTIEPGDARVVSSEQ